MFRSILYFFVFFILLIHPHVARANDQARRLVALLDYLSTDYRNAIKDGKILNPDEYGEMQEFAKRSLEILGRLKDTGNNDKADIKFGLKSLAEQIDRKAAPKVVAELAQSLKNQVVVGYKIVPYPQQLPALATGRKIYLENCALCHGESGRGDGPGSKTISPKQPPPANFTDPERMAGLTPFRVFNSATFGIEGTAMASFNALPEAQRWQVAFYVFSLRFSAESAKAGGQLLREKKVPAGLTSVATLATNWDRQLLEKLEPYAAGPSEAHTELAYLRRGILEQKPADPLIIARTRINEAAALYAKEQKEAAYQKAVEAYLDGFELAEPPLFAKDASFGRSLEAEFTQFRIAIKQGAALEEVQKRRRAINAKIEEAEKILSQGGLFSGYYAFVNSALIILREGLEAALILAAILATLRVMGATQAIRYIHLGWLLALGAGLLTWLATETVLTVSGRHRESMEGFISIFAAAALFYVGYWLHTRSEAKKWQAFIRAKVQDLVSAKRILALVGISFFAVYREALEVVLFYQALWLQNENNHALVIWGFAGGLGALVLATFAIFKLGLKLPLKYFFGATGTLLYILAFIFAGNGVKELQAALWLPTTPIGFSWQIPFLGIYPTVESLAAQAAMLVAFTATWFWLSSETQGAA
jgi:high-affinity iron transporter